MSIPADVELAMLRARVKRTEQVVTDLLMSPDGGRRLRDEVLRGYTDGGRHAMADPPEGESAAYELGYLTRKLREG